jgi:hypothetical protein
VSVGEGEGVADVFSHPHPHPPSNRNVKISWKYGGLLNETVYLIRVLAKIIRSL